MPDDNTPPAPPSDEPMTDVIRDHRRHLYARVPNYLIDEYAQWIGTTAAGHLCRALPSCQRGGHPATPHCG